MLHSYHTVSISVYNRAMSTKLERTNNSGALHYENTNSRYASQAMAITRIECDTIIKTIIHNCYGIWQSRYLYALLISYREYKFT